MTIDQTCLETEIQTAVDNLTTSCDAEVFLETALAADNANVNRKFSIALGCQLPDLATANIPEGTTVFVEELGVSVVSTGLAWAGLDGRTYRQDRYNKTLYAWGCNTAGQLGNDSTIYCVPSGIGTQEITSSTNWSEVTSDEAASYGIKDDGTLWSWGNNFGGLLGVNDQLYKSSPVQEASSSTNWLTVDNGITAVAIKTDGTLWGWGRNTYGSIGDGTVICRSSPVQEISSSTNWCKVSSGYTDFHAVKTDGTLWVSGRNTTGQLMTNNRTAYCSPVQEITSSTNWCHTSTGSFKSGAFVKTDGTLWTAGLNCFGQLGDGTVICRSSPVQEISSSTTWSLAATGDSMVNALKSDGTMWSFGSRCRGRLANGQDSFLGCCTPVQEWHSATNWCFVDSYFHGIGIKTDSTLWTWGCGNVGSLGINWNFSTCPYNHFVDSDYCTAAAGAFSSLAIRVST